MQKEALKSLRTQIEEAIKQKEWQYPGIEYHYKPYIKYFVQELMRKFYNKKRDGEENRQYYKEASTLIAKHEWAVKNKGLAIEVMKVTTFQDEKEKAEYDIFKKSFIETFIKTYYDPEANTMNEFLETAELLARHEWLTTYDEEIRFSRIIKQSAKTTR